MKYIYASCVDRYSIIVSCETANYHIPEDQNLRLVAVHTPKFLF